MNVYLLILMISLGGCIFFGVDSIVFISKRASILGNDSLLGFVVSAVVVVFGLLWYILTRPRARH